MTYVLGSYAFFFKTDVMFLSVRAAQSGSGAEADFFFSLLAIGIAKKIDKYPRSTKKPKNMFILVYL